MEAAENNFALNGLGGKAHIIHGDIKAAGAGYDIVLANIFLEPLLELMHPISAVLNPGGTLIISGLLEGQEQAVLQAADREGLLIVESHNSKMAGSAEYSSGCNRLRRIAYRRYKGLAPSNSDYAGAGSEGGSARLR